MKEELILFKTAKLAKEKGFLLYTPSYYANDKSLRKSDEYDEKIQWLADAPTQSLLQKWLRENHDIKVCVTAHSRKFYNENPRITEGEYIVQVIDDKDLSNPYKFHLAGGKNQYEYLFEKGLREALKLIKNEKNNIDS